MHRPRNFPRKHAHYRESQFLSRGHTLSLPQFSCCLHLFCILLCCNPFNFIHTNNTFCFCDHECMCVSGLTWSSTTSCPRPTPCRTCRTPSPWPRRSLESHPSSTLKVHSNPLLRFVFDPGGTQIVTLYCWILELLPLVTQIITLYCVILEIIWHLKRVMIEWEW